MPVNEKIKSDPVVVETVLKVPAERVWKALTDPADMKHWYFELKEFKPEPGFSFKLMGEKDNKKYPISCRVIEADKNKKLSYTWNYDDYPAETIVTFEILEQNDKTILQLTHSGFENIPAEFTEVSRESHAEGWNMIIGTLIKDYLGNNPV